jgi:hypothetical protein
VFFEEGDTADCETRVDGSFEIVNSKVRAGVIYATCFACEGLLPSPPARFEPTDGEITLRLQRAPLLFGVAIDGSTGGVCDASVEASLTGNFSGFPVRTLRGDWRLYTQGPGTFAISARTQDGGWAIEPGIVVPEAGSVGPIRLVLRKSARLNLRYSGKSKTLAYKVSIGDYAFAIGDFSARSGGCSVAVPSREVTVELTDGFNTWKQTRNVTPAPGETLDVQFE